jgi:AcrR family transcriptional regulator
MSDATMIPAHPGEGTRERILRLADELFARHGYARVSMRAVAGAAGVTKPALYYYFRDKDALYEECMLAMQQRQASALRDAADGAGSLGERLTAVAHALLTASAHHPIRVMSDVTEHLPPESRERLRRGFSESVVGPLAAFFTSAQERGEVRDAVTPELAAATLLGVCMSFLPAAADDPQAMQMPRVEADRSGWPDPDRAAGVVTDLVLRGVAAAPVTAAR